MITKKQLIDSFEQETRVIKHLWSKVTPQLAEFRPAPGMRTTLELLQYVSSCGVACAKCISADNWALYGPYQEQASALTLAQVPAALDRQFNEIKEVITAASEDDLRNRRVKYPWGVEEEFGIGLVNSSLKFMTAYKLQLFTYLKQAGLSNLNTMNAWGGVDGTMPAPQN